MQFFVLMQYDLYSCVIFAIQNVLILIEVNCLCFLIYEQSSEYIYIHVKVLQNPCGFLFTLDDVSIFITFKQAK